MGVREKMNQHQWVTVGATCAVILLALIFIAMRMRGDGPSAAAPLTGEKYFFTVDDGKTWFIDDATKFPPFTKDGKEAVRAHVYRTKDGKEFVGLLERYSAAGKKKLEAAAALPPDQGAMVGAIMEASEAMQWRKPGQSTWIGVTDPRAATVTNVVSPQGAGDPIQPVTP